MKELKRYTIEYRYYINYKKLGYNKSYGKEGWSEWKHWIHPEENFTLISTDINKIIKFKEKLELLNNNRVKSKYEYRIKQLG